MGVLLRNFLYLDDGLTSQYLAQLEDGVFDQESHETVRGRTGGAEASGKVGPLEARGSRGRTDQATISRTLQQTPESRYNRLEAILEEADGLQWLEAFDDQIWTSLKRGEVLQIEAKVDVPDLFKALDMADSAAPFIDLMEAMGEVDDDTRQTVEMARQLNGAVKNVTVVATALGAPRFKFICPLDPAHLRDSVGSLTGECQVVGTLSRRLKSTERYSLLDSVGLGGMPRDERRKAEREMKRGMRGSVISSPAAILTPLAIYR